MVLKDIAKGKDANPATVTNATGEVDALSAFSAVLLTMPPLKAAPEETVKQGERRAGHERRRGDRRNRAAEFTVSD